MHLLNSSSGSYVFSFYNIFLDNKTSPENIDLVLELETIIHEYIHFLQDISTVYGLTNTAKISKEIAFVYDKYHSSTETVVTTPISFDYDSETEKAINEDLFQLYFAHMSKEQKNLRLPKHLNIVIKNEKNGIIPGYEEVPEYNIVFSNKNYNKEIPFGAFAIMESMANLLERYIFPKEENNYIMPYDTAYVVANHIFPEFSTNPGAIFALCDASLMYYHSAEVFINALYMMRKMDFNYTSYNDIYTFIFGNIETGLSVRERFQSSVHEALKNIYNIQNTSNLSYASHWIAQTIDTICSYRLKSMDFLTRLFDFKSISALKIYLLKMISLVGSPLIYNKNGDHFVLRNVEESQDEEENQLLFWITAENIYKILKLRSPEYKCSLIPICTCTKTDYCNEFPWLQQHGVDKYCQFKIIWDAWGLKDKNIKKNV